MGPAVFYDLLGEDPVGVARHEAMHWLRDQGLITGREWNTLSRAAEEEGWHDRYHVNERWGDLAPSDDLKTEESVAEAFREWARTNEESRRLYSPVAQIFQKISDFLHGMMDRLKSSPSKNSTISKPIPSASIVNPSPTSSALSRKGIAPMSKHPSAKQRKNNRAARRRSGRRTRRHFAQKLNKLSVSDLMWLLTCSLAVGNSTGKSYNSDLLWLLETSQRSKKRRCRITMSRKMDCQ
jgi:hypothetical protein